MGRCRAFAEGLTNVSELIGTNDCECGDYFSNYYKHKCQPKPKWN